MADPKPMTFWQSVVFVARVIGEGIWTIIGGGFLLLWDKIRGK